MSTFIVGLIIIAGIAAGAAIACRHRLHRYDCLQDERVYRELIRQATEKMSDEERDSMSIVKRFSKRIDP